MDVPTPSRHACRPLFSLLILVLILCSFTTLATAKPLSLKQQRTLFIKAEKALKRGNKQQYQALSQQLANYPLLPYLTLQALRNDIATLDSAQAEAFLTRFQETPLAAAFRKAWLKELAERKQWWTYRVFYRPSSGVALECRHLQALMETGETETAFKQIPKLWLSSKSRPKTCDPIFDEWRKAGNLTQNLVWQRLELAMEDGNLKLARYLSRYLNKHNRQWYDYWLKVRKEPAKYLDHKKVATQPVNSKKIWLHGLKRLARKDIDQALTLWKKQQNSKLLSAEEHYEIERYLALRMIRTDRQQAAKMLAAFQPNADDERFIERRLRFGIADGDWDSVLLWLNNSPDEINSKERWRYWRAYALQTLGRYNEAKPIYQSLAAERSYHGFLAADELGVPYNLNHSPLQVPQELLTKTDQLPALQRAREFIALERYTEARREWFYATRHMPPEQLQAAARLAQSWDWHNQAIFTLARTRYWEDLELRFPVEHKKQVDHNAALRQLDNAWVFAVIRQESAFSPVARSRVGALGLMQLMPNTAKHVAKKIKHKRPRQSDLLTPQTNIKFGTAYLREVLDQLGKHQVLATAAYNAGPHRVKSWLPQQELEANRWVEMIPFNETRKYTERVLSYAVIYERRLGKKLTRISQRMTPINSKQVITAKR